LLVQSDVRNYFCWYKVMCGTIFVGTKWCAELFL